MNNFNIKDRLQKLFVILRIAFWSFSYYKKESKLKYRFNRVISIYEDEGRYIVHYKHWGTLKIFDDLEEARKFRKEYIHMLVNKMNATESIPDGIKIE